MEKTLVVVAMAMAMAAVTGMMIIIKRVLFLRGEPIVSLFTTTLKNIHSFSSTGKLSLLPNYIVRVLRMLWSQAAN